MRIRWFGLGEDGRRERDVKGVESCRYSSVTGVYFFQAEDGIRDRDVTGVQTCALPSGASIQSFVETNSSS